VDSRQPDKTAEHPAQNPSRDLRQLPEKFVVGLGNPTRRYAETRHNVGFRVVEALRRRWRLDEGRKVFSGRLYDARLSRPEAPERHVRLLRPHTYMNCSGKAVRELAGFYKVRHENILIVLDDLALTLGYLRVRAAGSAGGHNGLGDVLEALGSEKVPRLRIGIGSPPELMDPRDFVLSPFRPDETEKIEHAIRLAAEAVEDWIFNDLIYVMDKYNRKATGLEKNGK